MKSKSNNITATNFAIFTFSGLILLGCATGYNPSSSFGGYVDQIGGEEHFQGNPYYYAAFNGNGYTTPEKTEELSLLRCAERAYQDGYNYFVKVVQHSQVNQTGTINTASAVAMPYGGAIAIGQSTPTFAPNGASTVLAFQKPPPKGMFKPNWTVRNIESYASEMKQKYGATIRTDVRSSSRSRSFFSKHLNDEGVSIIGDIINDVQPEPVTFHDFRKAQQFDNVPASLLIGGVFFVEIPYESDDKELIEIVTKKAELLRANHVLIREIPQREHEAFNYFYAIEFRFAPQGRVGLTFEPSLVGTDVYKVRTLDRNDEIIKYGDIIQSVDGVDFLSLKGKVSIDDYLTFLIRSKKPGEQVKIGIVRENAFKTVEVKLLPNK
jgi:hypothetical protein